jgi:hypothetical protein
VNGKSLNQYSVETYVTSQLETGYDLLAQEGEGRWYWGVAHDEYPDFTETRLHGPCCSRGEAIAAGEHGVERSTLGSG